MIIFSLFEQFLIFFNSTRRLTVEKDRDENSPGIVKVSENVVRRLKGEKELPLDFDEQLTKDDINRLWKELQQEKSLLEHQKEHVQEVLQRAFDEGRQVEAKRLQKARKSSEDITSKDTTETENNKIQQERDVASRDEKMLELEYLREKVAQQEKVTTEHFQGAVEEVSKKFSLQSRAPVCQHLHNEVLNCYKQHPTESLRCSQQVKDFIQCVEQSRLMFLQESK